MQCVLNMACNGVLPPPPHPPKVSPPKRIGNPPSPNIFYPPTPICQSPQCFYPTPTPLQLEVVASAFFTYGYFQQAHVHISEAIITD